MNRLQQALLSSLLISLVACGGDDGGPKKPTPLKGPTDVGSPQPASTLSVNSVYETTVEKSEGDVFLDIALTPGQSYSADLISEDSSTSMSFITVTDSQKNAITDRQSVPADGVVSLEFQASSESLHYIKLNAVDFSRFSLAVNSSDVVHDDSSFEPNNTKLVVFTAQYGATYQGQVARTDREDWFRIEVEAGKTINALISNTANRYNQAQAQLIDSNGAPLTNRVFVQKFNTLITKQMATTGPFYLRLNGIGVLTPPFAYTVNFEESTGGPTAEALAVNTTREFTKRANTLDTYLRLLVVEGETYIIEILNLLGGGLYTTIIDGNQSPVFRREDYAQDAFRVFEYKATATSTLDVVVDSPSALEHRYQVAIHTTDAPQDDTTFEPNSTQSSAYPVSLDSQYSSEIGKGDWFDWYSVDVSAGDRITAQVTGEGEGSNLARFGLFDNVGNLLTSEPDVRKSVPASVTATVNYTGKVYLKVRYYGNTTSPLRRTQKYNFKLGR